MLHCHDLAVLCPGSHFQALRHGLRCRGQRVIPGHGKSLRQSFEQQAASLLPYHGLLSMHQGLGVGDRRAKGCADRLVSQAHAQQRDILSQLLCCLDDDSRILRPSRTGGKDDPVRFQFPDLLNGHLVVPDYLDIRIQLSDQLIQVVGKAVIVVDQQCHPSISFPAFSREFSTARALFRHSSCSFSGTESYTIPAPERTNTLPFFLYAIRIAMQVSMFPAKSI